MCQMVNRFGYCGFAHAWRSKCKNGLQFRGAPTALPCHPCIQSLLPPHGYHLLVMTGLDRPFTPLSSPVERIGSFAMRRSAGDDRLSENGALVRATTHEIVQRGDVDSMVRRAALLAICLALSGCAAVPNEHALVKDEAAAIAIGKKACTENQREVVQHDLSDRKWGASFDAKDGYWWVHKYVSLAPSPNVMGLQVLVNAMSGNPTSCDLEYVVEY